MKKNILYTIALFLTFSSTTVMACCNTENLYLVTNVKTNDTLNLRQEPHPLSPIVATLSHNKRYFVLKKYLDKNEEMLTHNLCVTINYAPFNKDKSTSKWCQLENPKGWVNMHYLKSCTVKINDEGFISDTQCTDVVKGKRVTDYLFKDKN